MSEQISKGQIVILICLIILIILGRYLFGLGGAVLGGAMGVGIGYGLVKILNLKD